MIIEFGARRIAVRADEAGAVYTAMRTVERDMTSTGQAGSDTRAVVELSVALGGMTMRAGLGAQFVAHPDHTTTVRVGIGAPLGIGALPTCHSELGKSLVPGLPDDFADVVLEALASDERYAVPHGTLTVDRACYDEVGSSAMAFRRAASLLRATISALSLGNDPTTALETVVRSW